MDNLKNKNLIIIIAAAILLIAAYFFYGAGSKNQLTLTLDFGDGNKRTFVNNNTEEKKAWDALQEVAAIASIDLEPDQNFLPRKIDGCENNGQKSWFFYINNAKQEISPIEVKVKPPDQLIFKFE
ncbi:MAG: hypothetical protein ABIJ28_00095 [Patescibacteria group bacterium]